jgi:ABC-2 type transport system permease protein
MHILPLIKKEIYHIVRDIRSLMIIILMPLMMMIIFGYAITLDVKQIPLAVLDHENSAMSREVVQQFIAQDYFRLTGYLKTGKEIEEGFQTRKFRAALVIPNDFSLNMETAKKPVVQIVIDGSESNTGMLISNYASMIVINFNFSLKDSFRAPFRIEPRIWYNEDLISAAFFVPGLVAMILILISALLTSITIAREKETGTMEQMLVAPVHPVEIILGKVIPYIFLAFLDGLIVLGVAYFWFDVPFEGSFVTLLIMMVVYVYTSLCIGIFISTIAETQQVAMMATLIATLMPTVLLSGFIFPLDSLIPFIQYMSYAIPARYFLIIIRAVMLKGTGWEYLWPQVVALFAIGCFIIFVSTKKFKMHLE